MVFGKIAEDCHLEMLFTARFQGSQDACYERVEPHMYEVLEKLYRTTFKILFYARFEKKRINRRIEFLRTPHGKIPLEAETCISEKRKDQNVFDSYCSDDRSMLFSRFSIVVERKPLHWVTRLHFGTVCRSRLLSSLEIQN